MKKTVLWVLIVVIVLSFLLTFLLPSGITTITPTPSDSATEPPPRNDVADPNTVVVDPSKALADQISVSSPSKNSTVSSPFTIKGKAVGKWYFEGSFPVELVDAKTGLDIAKGTAKAEGDWMTDNFVPFSVELKFTTPPTATQANLIFKKDNPSGLAENDASISIPVTVK